jgi:hypothetical protein
VLYSHALFCITARLHRRCRPADLPAFVAEYSFPDHGFRCRRAIWLGPPILKDFQFHAYLEGDDPAGARVSDALAPNGFPNGQGRFHVKLPFAALPDTAKVGRWMTCISELLFSAAAKVHKIATRGLAWSCRSKLKRRALTPDAPIRHDQHLLLLHCRGRQVYGSQIRCRAGNFSGGFLEHR